MKRMALVGAALSALVFSAVAQSRALESQHARGMCLQVTGSGATISRCDRRADQEVEFGGYGTVKINGQCLSTNGENRPLVLKPCANDRAQRWTLNPRDHRGALRNEEGWCADVYGEGTADGTAVHAYRCDPNKRVDNQRWLAKETKRASTPAALAAPAAPVAQAAPWSLSLQRVTAVRRGDGGYDFKSLDGKHVLATMDSKGNIVAAGAGNIVAAGGGNIVAAGGGNILVNNGGNIVAAGGGNLTMPDGRVVQIVAAGGGNLVAAGAGNVVAAGTPLRSCKLLSRTARVPR